MTSKIVNYLSISRIRKMKHVHWGQGLLIYRRTLDYGVYTFCPNPRIKDLVSYWDDYYFNSNLLTREIKCISYSDFESLINNN